MYVTPTTNDQVLVHHGIRGQHWGVRRYQNTDGTYTPLGREHYGIGQGHIASPSSKPVLTARQKKKYSDDAIFKSMERQEGAALAKDRQKLVRNVASLASAKYRRKDSKVSYKISRIENRKRPRDSDEKRLYRLRKRVFE